VLDFSCLLAADDDGVPRPRSPRVHLQKETKKPAAAAASAVFSLIAKGRSQPAHAVSVLLSLSLFFCFFWLWKWITTVWLKSDESARNLCRE